VTAAAEQRSDDSRRTHWNTVISDGSLSDQMIKDMIEDSYDLVVSKLRRAQQEALDWHPHP
jgi:predicted DNA-binding protein (MmcQ/YjbR family)